MSKKTVIRDYNENQTRLVFVVSSQDCRAAVPFLQFMVGIFLCSASVVLLNWHRVKPAC